MKDVKQRVKINTEEDREAVHRILDNQTDEKVLRIYKLLSHYTVLCWKDSFRDVLDKKLAWKDSVRQVVADNSKKSIPDTEKTDSRIAELLDVIRPFAEAAENIQWEFSRDHLEVSLWGSGKRNSRHVTMADFLKALEIYRKYGQVDAVKGRR